MPLVLETLLYYVASLEILLIPVKAQIFGRQEMRIKVI